MKTPEERDDLDLLELVCQLHYRIITYPENKEMHDASVQARQELERRLVAYQLKSTPPQGIDGERVSTVEIDFGGNVKALMIITNNIIRVTDAMNGYGDRIDESKIIIQSLNKTQGQ